MKLSLNPYRVKNQPILVFALASSVLATLINRAWMFDPYGWVDQWGYFGAAFFFPHLGKVMPDHPVNGLIAVYGPSALFMRVFSPVFANYFRDFLALFISLASIGSVVAKATTKKIGMIIIALMTSYQYFLTTVGSSYTDGAMLFYLSISFALLSWTQSQNGNRQKLGLVGFGVLYGFMVFTAVLGVVYFLVLFLFFSMGKKEEKKILGLLKDLINFLKFSTIGFIVTTFIFQVVYSTYSSGFFYSSNIEKFFGYTVGNQYRAPAFSDWLPGATWLVLPGSISLSALGCLVIRIPKISRFQFSPIDKLLILAPLSFTISLFIQLVAHQYSLQFLYFNQTIPIYFLSLGALVYLIISQRSEEKYWLTLSVFATVVVLLFTRYLDFTSYTFTSVILRMFILNSPQLVLFLSIAVGALILFLATRLTVLSPLALSILLLFSIFSFSPTYGCFSCYNANAAAIQPAPASSTEVILRNVVHLSSEIDKIDSKREAKLWFSEFEPLGPIFRQVNAVTYLNSPSSRVSKSFPEVTDVGAPLGSESSGMSKTSMIIILSSDPGSVQVGQLSASNSGVSFEDINTFQIQLVPTGVVYFTILTNRKSQN